MSVLDHTEWDSFWEKHKEELVIDEEIVKVLRRYVKRGDKLLEAGCGSAATTIPFSKEIGISPVLSDFSQKAVDLACAYAKKIGVKAKCVRGDICKLPFKNNTFDIVWNEGVFIALKDKDRKKAINEMTRVCKPGGYIIIFTNNADCLTYKINRKLREKIGLWRWGKEKPLTLKELLDLIKPPSKVVENGESNHLEALFNFPLLFPIFRKAKHKFQISDRKIPGLNGLQVYVVARKSKKKK